MVDHVMSKMGLAYNNRENGYYIEAASDKAFFPDRQANLYVLGQKCGVKKFFYFNNYLIF